uniref:Proline rich 23C n=1 Tax=Sus scrofa TaxID=9823 RepID=A0A287B7Z9_PIG
VMGSRPRSPSAYPADWWAPESGRQGLTKRRRPAEPAGPESVSEAPPCPDNRTEPAAALTSVVVLAAGCALHLALDNVDVVLEPEPTSVLQVSLGDRTLILVPEALLGSGVECPGEQNLTEGAFLSAPGESLALGEGFFCAAVPEIACQEEANEEDSDTEFLSPAMDAAAGSVPGPERRSPPQDYSLDLHLPEPSSDSPLQPLPPSPSPGPHERPQRPHGPARKARKCLFPE